jgi:hypothetical protein
MPVKTKPRPHHKVLNWATVDITNPEEVAELQRLEEKRAGVLARKAVAELQALGIVDRQGRRIKKELPPDMRDDSQCDL